MSARLDARSLARWRADPLRWIESHLLDPETRAPFKLLDAERTFLTHAFTFDDDGRMVYPELLYGAPKKSGKTTLAALFLITLLLLYGGAYPEALAVANSFEQVVSRCFAMVRRIIECSPLLKREAKITEGKVTLAGAVIQAIPSDYSTASGSNQNCAVFDELWAYDRERDIRLFDELVPPPTRRVACRLTVTYAGFTGESTLLQSLYERGLQQPQIGPALYAGDGLLMFWSHEPIAPWQTPAWIESMRRSLRPPQFTRMIRNTFVAAESAFIDLQMWDAITDDRMGHTVSNKNLPCWAGVDASVRRDATALALVTWDEAGQRVVLCDHQIFTPSAGMEIDFEASVESTLMEWHRRFNLLGTWYDPFQMVAVAQRLTKAGLTMIEYPQTVGNLTAMGENLFELIKGKNLLVYRDPEIRTAVSRAIAVESGRGWRISKEKQSHRVDVVVSIGLAALAAVRGESNPSDSYINALADSEPEPPLVLPPRPRIDPQYERYSRPVAWGGGLPREALEAAGLLEPLRRES